MKNKLLTIIIAVLPLLCSCLGINADIVLNRDGSGTVDLEYRIDRSLDSLGRLDGNERWNTIPVGRADFERTLDRLPDIKLLSFSSREDGKNLNISVRLEFSSIQGLLAFFDAAGQRSAFTGNPSSGQLIFTLGRGGRIKNADLDSLIAGISRGYSVTISMTFPGEGNLAVRDLNGNPFNAGVNISRGRKVSSTFPLYDILTENDGINLVFSW